MAHKQRAWVDMASGGQVHTALGLSLPGTFSSPQVGAMDVGQSVGSRAVSQNAIRRRRAQLRHTQHAPRRESYCVSPTHRPFVTLDPDRNTKTEPRCLRACLHGVEVELSCIGARGHGGRGAAAHANAVSWAADLDDEHAHLGRRLFQVRMVDLPQARTASTKTHVSLSTGVSPECMWSTWPRPTLLRNKSENTLCMMGVIDHLLMENTLCMVHQGIACHA